MTAVESTCLDAFMVGRIDYIRCDAESRRLSTLDQMLQGH